MSQFKDASGEIAELAKEYNYKDPPELLVKLQEFLSDLLRRFSDFLKSFRIEMVGDGNTNLVSDLLQILLLSVGIACLVALVYFTWTKMSNLDEQSRKARKGARSSAITMDSHAWRLEAERLVERNEFKDAVRAIYLSLLHQLDEAGIIDFAITRSNYEYLYALDSRRDLVQSFKIICDRFESIWFGDRPAGASDYELCDGALIDIESKIAKMPDETIR